MDLTRLNTSGHLTGARHRSGHQGLRNVLGVPTIECSQQATAKLGKQPLDQPGLSGLIPRSLPPHQRTGQGDHAQHNKQDAGGDRPLTRHAQGEQGRNNERGNQKCGQPLKEPASRQ